MRWRSTFWLVAGAVGLFLFIWLVERQSSSTDQQTASQPLLAGLRPREVDSIQVQRTNAFILQVQRTNGTWQYVAPSPYPAESIAIRAFLDFAEKLTRDFLVTDDLGALRGEKTNIFGLDRPSAVLTLTQGGLRHELRLGARTLAGDQVYGQLVGSPGVYALPGALLDGLPNSSHDWRETSMIHWDSFNFNRLSISNGSKGFSLSYDATNRVFSLRKPFQARVDNSKVGLLLKQVALAQVTKFVSDHSRVDLEAYGLQPPALELALGIDTNDLSVVQFGSSPTNDASQVYARLLAHNNIVLLPKEVFQQLNISYTDLRDSRILSFPLDSVDSMEVRGEDSFSVRRQSKDQWQVQPGGAMADSTQIKEALTTLRNLTATEFTKDFVEDYAPYGLVPPGLSFILRSSPTNSIGIGTNTLVAQIDLGIGTDGKVYARRPDESSVYAIALADALKLPNSSWKLRDRKIWSFSTNEVVGVTIEQGGRKARLIRSPEGRWSEAPGSIFKLRNDFSLEETMFRVSQLHASVWAARGETNRSVLGFSENGHHISVDIKRNGEPQVYSVEFGNMAPSGQPYAATKLDGEWWFFECPSVVYFAVMRDLNLNLGRVQP